MPSNELFAGTSGFQLNDSDSLAAAIERGMNEARAEFGLPPMDTDATAREDRTPFILGLAKGIISYLVDHEQAFLIPSDEVDGDTHSHDGHIEIGTP